MKKLLFVLSVLFVGLLAACGNDEEVIKIGATSTPHAEVLEEAKPLLEEEGITIEIEEYTEFHLPNQDLDNGTIDLNYFQHIPFFNDETTDEAKGYDLVNLGGIHVEPMGIYSQTIKSVDEIEEGTDVLISRNDPDHGRILALFESEGLITLKEGTDKETATLDDIDENPLGLNFEAAFDPAFIVEAYNSEEDALVAINTNYALDADLNPLEDSIFYEGSDSLYVNIIAARAEDKDNEDYKKIVEVLQSEEIQNFILNEYGGAVVPVSDAE